MSWSSISPLLTGIWHSDLCGMLLPLFGGTLRRSINSCHWRYRCCSIPAGAALIRTRWLDEFDDPALAENLYDNSFAHVDVTVIADDEIADHRSLAALTLLQKYIHQRDLAELVDRLPLVLLDGYLSSSQVISLVHYSVLTGETSDAEAFVRELALRVPQHEDANMTIAQQLEQKGIE